MNDEDQDDKASKIINQHLAGALTVLAENGIDAKAVVAVFMYGSPIEGKAHTTMSVVARQIPGFVLDESAAGGLVRLAQKALERNLEDPGEVIKEEIIRPAKGRMS